MSQLTYEHVTMQFQDVTALENVSFALESGRIYGLLGRNGAGKSTLLSLSAGWRRQTSGRVLLDGDPVWENAAALSQIVCTSDGNMFPSMTVEKGMRWYARYRPGFSMTKRWIWPAGLNCRCVPKSSRFPQATVRFSK